MRELLFYSIRGNTQYIPLLLLCFCIAISEAWAHRFSGRAGLQTSVLFETLHRVEGDQVFGERISATAHYEQLLRLLLGIRLYTANTCTASTLIGYIEQAQLAMSGNGASGSFGTDPLWVLSELHIHVYCFRYKHVGSYSNFYL